MRSSVEELVETRSETFFHLYQITLTSDDFSPSTQRTPMNVAESAEDGIQPIATELSLVEAKTLLSLEPDRKSYSSSTSK